MQVVAIKPEFKSAKRRDFEVKMQDKIEEESKEETPRRDGEIRSEKHDRTVSNLI